MNSPVTIPIPKRIAKLPVDERGYPIPFFVGYDDRGLPDFRMMDAHKLSRAIKDRLCWICGQPLGHYLAFCIGPMCALNRNNAEPPMHKECAEFSVQACPFLLNPDQKRNPRKVHGEWREPAGEMIKRNPGVALIWITDHYDVYIDHRTNGPLFRLGEALEVSYWREGRPAHRHEIVESIESGLPILMEMAQTEGHKAVEALLKARDAVYKLLPVDANGPQSEVDAPA
jgi:hypothetical protein